MARNSVTKLYTTIPGGVTQGTDLRNWMVANLTKLTVGPMYTLGTGISERNWWTLAFDSGAEILVYCPNGTYTYGDDGYVERNTVEGSFQQALMFVYFPDGGAEAALANGEDPDTSAFKDYVVGTLEMREPDKGHQMLWWRAGSGVNHQLHVIEDDSGTSVGIILSQAGGIGGSTYMSGYFVADDMWDEYPTTSMRYVNPQGCIFVESGQNATKTYRHLHACAWRFATDTRLLVSTAQNVLPFTAPNQDTLVAGRYPSGGTGKHYAAQLCLFPSSGEILKANKNYIKITGQHMPLHNTSFGNSADYNYIKLVQRFLFMWDASQAEPT